MTESPVREQLAWLLEATAQGGPGDHDVEARFTDAFRAAVPRLGDVD